MKNYPIIKSNEAVTVLFTAPRQGFVLEYFDDHYKDIQYKSDWSEGAFSNVEGNWFKGKCIVVNNDDERDFVRKLIFNQSGVLFSEPSVSNARLFYVEGCCWCHTRFEGGTVTGDGLKQLHIPFNEIFNDTTVTTELKGVPPSPSASVKDRYRACVNLMNDLLAENERCEQTDGYLFNEKQVWLINELINTSQLLIDQKTHALGLKTKLANHFNRPISDNNVEKCIDELIAGYNAAAELQERYDLSSHDKRTLNEIIQLLDGTNNATVDASNVYETVKNVFTQWEMFGIAKPASKTPPVEWKETHEVKIGDTWFQVEPVFVSEVEVFFYDPRPTPPAIAPTNSVRQSNLSVINLNSPDYRNNEIGYLCIDDDGVLHPYNPESPMTEVKLCKNIL